MHDRLQSKARFTHGINWFIVPYILFVYISLNLRSRRFLDLINGSVLIEMVSYFGALSVVRAGHIYVFLKNYRKYDVNA